MKANLQHLIAGWTAALLTATASLAPLTSAAQLSKNPDKFLGNITTTYQIDYGSEKFYQLWNQITPENETKWSSVEGTRGSYNWGNADNINRYAKQHNFPFKFHTLVWGSQFPGWVKNLSVEERYKAIVKWMDAAKKRYPDLAMIDVVNEAIEGHQADTPYIKEALGGGGKTGYDWIIKAFEMAYERWPDAILIYNDFNTFQWNTDQFIDLVRTLRDAGAPVDAYGCQSHDLTDCNVSTFKNSMVKLQSALKMPMYSTEYDIGTDDDNLQLQRFKEQIPYMWEADYCAGITLWGYIYGKTWTNDGKGYSGIIKNGQDRPAMTWLREYMQSDKALNAKSPFPGMVKEASVYVRPASLSVTKGEETTIEVRAKMKTKTIERVELYAKNQLIATMTEAPYIATFTPGATGKYELKAVVVNTDGTQYERLSNITAYNPRAPHKTIELPGTLQGEDFDAGADGISYHDSDSQQQGSGASYRSDAGSVDIEKISSGYAVGWTHAGEWLEYTVNVLEAGLYEFDAYFSSQDGGGSFSIQLSEADGLTDLTAVCPVVKTGNWSTYKAQHGRLTKELAAGKQVLRFNIVSGDLKFNFDKIVFRRIDIDNDIQIALTADPAPVTVNTSTTLTIDATTPNSTIANVKVYVDQVLLKTLTTAPYTTTYKPTTKGSYAITAFATDTEGRQSPLASYTLKVTPKRTPYKGTINLPGIIQAENFDKGEEGFTFHDSDTEDQGKANYRSDNGGIDIVTGNGGYVLGYTVVGEWTEYSVNVTEPGEYTYEATVSSGATNSSFTISLADGDELQQLARVKVPQTGSNTWDTYRVVKGKLTANLDEGTHIIRFTITGANCNIDKVELKCSVNTGIGAVATHKVPANATYNLSGQRVGTDYKGIVIRNGKKFLQR